MMSGTGRFRFSLFPNIEWQQITYQIIKTHVMIHLSGWDDRLVKAAPLLEKSIDWRQYLYKLDTQQFADKIGCHQRTGRPLGSSNFLEKLENLLDRRLKPGKAACKPNKDKQ